MSSFEAQCLSKTVCFLSVQDPVVVGLPKKTCVTTRTVFPSRDEIMLTGVYNNEIRVTPK